MAELLQYRFPRRADRSRSDSSSLAGHAVGNLLIAALTAIEGGDFEEGVRQMNRVLAVRGQVLPVSPTPLILHARARRTARSHGQSRDRPDAGHRAGLAGARRRARVSEDALRAIAEADVVVLGPGSLYTSILPSLLLPRDPRRRPRLDRALRVYVCNVATQDGETAGYDLADHVEALARPHGARHSSTSSSPTATSSTAARRRAQRRRSSCAGRRPAPAAPRLVLDDVVDPGRSALTTIRPPWRRPSSGSSSARAAPGPAWPGSRRTA